MVQFAVSSRPVRQLRTILVNDSTPFPKQEGNENHRVSATGLPYGQPPEPVSLFPRAER